MEKQERLFPKTIYCIDSSALINITRYPGYPRDIFPSIWNKLETMVKEGVLISHAEVFKELKRIDDKIVEWCKQNKKMFRELDECQMKEYEKIKTKYDHKYWKMKTNKNGPWADPWLIALCICERTNTTNVVIITDEKNKENNIPHIARLFNIRCINLIEFFKEIGIKY